MKFISSYRDVTSSGTYITNQYSNTTLGKKGSSDETSGGSSTASDYESYEEDQIDHLTHEGLYIDNEFINDKLL